MINVDKELKKLIKKKIDEMGLPKEAYDELLKEHQFNAMKKRVIEEGVHETINRNLISAGILKAWQKKKAAELINKKLSEVYDGKEDDIERDKIEVIRRG